MAHSIGNESTIRTTPPKRILIISEEPHLALALQVLFSEQGHIVRCESDSSRAMLAVRESRPDAILTASASTVFVSSSNSGDIVDLPRPVDASELLRILERLK